MKIEEIQSLIAEQRAKNPRTPIQVINLQGKNIKDFTTEDSVYLSTTGEFPIGYLCQFVKFENGKVTGRALQAMTNPDLHVLDINRGLEITAPLERVSLFGKLPKDNHNHYFQCNSLGKFYSDNLEIPEDDMNISNHESYGMISLTKSQSSRAVNLFGSSIKHSELITLRINRGEVKRNLNSDWYSSREGIVEVHMSHSQFAELITTFNRGEGTPCTLKYVSGKKMEEPHFVSKVQQVSNEFRNKMVNLTTKLKNMMENTDEILDKKTVSKGDRDILKNEMRSLMQEIQSNLPFMADQFSEQMDKTVSEAKAEIEAFLTNRVEDKGLLNSPNANFLLGNSNEEKDSE
jgi:ElaB/YqjD/DUF883 family membrane-anchored ribosome-binding protein